MWTDSATQPPSRWQDRDENGVQVQLLAEPTRGPIGPAAAVLYQVGVEPCDVVAAEHRTYGPLPLDNGVDQPGEQGVAG
jgi:hypothetical protein